MCFHLSKDERDQLLEGLGRIAWAFEHGTNPYVTGLKMSARKEQSLHEAIHMTILGIPFTPLQNHEMSDHISVRIGYLGRLSVRRENEIRTLAAELLILRALKNFLPEGEENFLSRIAEDQGMKTLPRRVLARVDKLQAEVDAALTVKNVSQWAEDLNYVTC